MTEDLWHRYAKIWLQQGAERDTEMACCLSDAIVYRDPQIEAKGKDAFSRYISDFQDDYPGCGFVIKKVSSHNGRSLADWDCVDASGKMLFSGISFAVVNPNGQFTELNGFYPVEV